MQLLRVRADTDNDVKYAVRETFHIEYARQREPLIARERYILLQSLFIATRSLIFLVISARLKKNFDMLYLGH